MHKRLDGHFILKVLPLLFKLLSEVGLQQAKLLVLSLDSDRLVLVRGGSSLHAAGLSAFRWLRH